MPQQGAETMEVVVRGHAESSTFDDERGTQVVTDGQITEAHATSLADGVRQTPGLSVGQTTPGQGTIYVRGLSGRAVAHSVDGVRLNAAIFRAGNNPYLGLIDPYSLHRISAVPGAASVEFGSDALGGALLFSTVVPGFTARGTQDAMRLEQHFSSNPLGSMSHVDWTHRTRYVSFHAGLTHLTASDVRPGEGQQTPNASSYVGLMRPTEDEPYRPQTQVAQRGTDFDFVAANATLHAKMASFGVIARAQLGMRPNLNRYDRITPRFQGSVPSRYEASVEPMSRNMGSLTFSHRAPQGLYKGSELMLAWQRLREITKDRAYDEVCTVGNDFADSGCPGALQLVPARTERREMNRSDAFTARFVSTLVPASPITLRAGFEVRTDIITSTADRYDHADGETTKDLSRYPSGSTSNEGGLFAKGEYRSKRFSFSAGVRAMGFWLDIQSRSGSPSFERTLLDYSAEMGARILIGSPLAFVVNAGRGVRMPNVADFSTLGPRAQGRYQVPNAHIGAEHSWTVDSGLKMRSKAWTLDTFVFATRYDDAIILLPTRVAGQEFTTEGERYYHSENAARVDYIGLHVSGAVPLGRAARLWGRWLALLGQQTNPPDSTAPRRTPQIACRLRKANSASR